MFPYFEFFGRTVGSYGLCAVAGLLVCGFVCTALGKPHKIFCEDVIMLLLAASTGIFLGGHLFYGLLQIDNIARSIQALESVTFSSVIYLFAVGFGGSVFYGGLFGAVAAVCIHGKRKGRKSLYLDLFAVCAPLFHAFGRIGCFLGGCCYGIESRFGFTAHNNPYIPEINGVSRFPVQLLEAVLNALLFLSLLIIYKKGKHSGKLIFIYTASYAVIRFLLEFLRGDSARGGFLFLSTSQWISAALLPCVIFLWFAVSRKSANKKR